MLASVGFRCVMLRSISSRKTGRHHRRSPPSQVSADDGLGLAQDQTMQQLHHALDESATTARRSALQVIK